MKHLFTVTISLFFLAIVGLAQPTGTRQIMIEEFTQASCGPCGSQNPAFNELINANTDIVNALKYQTSWPGYDPMYEQNPVEVDVRTNYYSVTGVPRGFMDGSIFEGSPSDFNQTLLDGRAGIAAPIEIDVVWDWMNNNLDSIEITVTVMNTNSGIDFSDADKLHIAIVEEEIEFPIPPGTNGEQLFEMIMRKMIPNENGTPLSTVFAGNPLIFNFFVEIPSYIYRKGMIGVVAFAQNNSTKEIYNSGYNGPVDFPPGANIFDLAASANSLLPNNYCDYSFTAGVDISNEGVNTITSFDVYYNINQDPNSEVINVTAPLLGGETTTILFPEIVVSNGKNIVNYWVDNINSGVGADIDYMNNIISEDVFYNLSTSSVATGMDEGFEDVPLTWGPFSHEFPNGLFISTGLGMDKFGIVDGSIMGFPPIGGYAESLRTIFFHFLWITEVVEFDFLIDKMDLTENDHPFIAFDRAYAMTDENTDDELTVYASVDCGNTWDEVYHKQGEELVTAPALLGLFMPTTAEEWTTDTIDIADYANMDEVVFKFSGLSTFEGALYIDNIRISDLEITGTVETTSTEQNFKIYPNPATDVINVGFDNAETSSLTISIFNLSGQKLKTISSHGNIGQSIQIDISDLSKGLYYLKLISEKSNITSKPFLVR